MMWKMTKILIKIEAKTFKTMVKAIKVKVHSKRNQKVNMIKEEPRENQGLDQVINDLYY